MTRRPDLRSLLALAALTALTVAYWPLADVPLPYLVCGAVAGVLAALTAARPELRDHWLVGVAVGGLLVTVGATLAATSTGLGGQAVGLLAVALGVVAVLNKLGVAPWSDEPRRV